MKKILIVYATAGIGHKKAAFAVKEALGEIAPRDVEVSIIDCLDYTNAFFRWSYLKGYLFMVNGFPKLWGLFYHLTDNFYFNLAFTGMRKFGNMIHSRRFIKYLIESEADVIISTHFFASEVASDLKKKGLLKSHIITVVTDYRLHSWWIADRIDDYVVGSEAARKDLIRWKIKPSSIKILGITIEPIFAIRLDRDKILGSLDFKDDIFTILVIGGGFGVGPIEDIVKIASSISKPVQIIAVCGHNEELVKRLGELKNQIKADIRIFGFVNNVYEYMEISDILISKSGGITVAESMAKELPMVVISPIIGQETRNASFLTDNAAAIKIDKIAELKGILEDLVSHPEKIEKMRGAINMIKRPIASYDVARLALELIK